MKLINILPLLQLHWFKVILMAMLLYLVQHKNLNLEFNLMAKPVSKISSSSAALMGASSSEKNNISAEHQTNLGFGESLAQTYRKITNSGEAKKKEKPAKVYTPEQLKKLKIQKKYVERFARVAQAEMKKFGIPASIKLAQGLVETNAGGSTLSLKNNNHFGMKCFSKKCSEGHCSNFTDDSHKDFFRVYGSAWESYRSHSQMLVNNKRYKKLFDLEITDYKAWAKGLKKAGYATDKKYAEKLIEVIEELELYQYDEG